MTRQVKIFDPSCFLFPHMSAEYDTEKETEEDVKAAAAEMLGYGVDEITICDADFNPANANGKIVVEPVTNGYKFRKEAI